MKKSLYTLFKSTFLLSAFTFGGGYVIIALMEKKFCDEYQWITKNQMLDYISIAQSSPGAIAINGASAIGYSLFGIKGLMVAIIATILPPFMIISIIRYFYKYIINNVFISLLLEGMLIGVGVVIICVALSMIKQLIKLKNPIFNILFILSFILNLVFNINIIYLILTSIILAIIHSSLNKRRCKL